MDFYQHQRTARRKSVLLIAMMTVNVVIVVLAIYVISLQPYLAHLSSRDPQSIGAFPLWQPELFTVVAIVVLGVLSLAGVLKIVSLRKGGAAVARLLDARLVQPGSPHLQERRLLNVVEEMSIASGMTVLPVYVLEMPSINAFAAGWSRASMVLVVTRGCMTYLTRDELQAVIAHELSQVLHGDTRANVWLLGVLHAITCIGTTGRALMRLPMHTAGWESDEARKVGCATVIPLAMLGAALSGIGYSGLLAARIVRSAFAREREYLADAAAVQFTRDPESLASALKKIGGHSAGSRILHRRAEELSHFFFSDGSKDVHRKRGGWFRGWLRTHPSLFDRIERIEGRFDGNYIVPAEVEAD